MKHTCLATVPLIFALAVAFATRIPLRVAIHVNLIVAQVMNMALNNARTLTRSYDSQIELQENGSAYIRP